MEKKVLLKDLVDFGSNIRKQITSKVRVSDQGVYPIGEIWDANTTIDVIVNGAHEQHDTIRELDVYAHNTQRQLTEEIARATEAEQDLDNKKADKEHTYTKNEIDALLGSGFNIVDQYAIYSFESFSAETGTKWAEGRAQLTGVVSGNFTEIVVLNNTEEGFVGQHFFIPSNAQADGLTKFPLYNSEKDDTGIKVSILKESDTTYKPATIKEYIDSLVGQGGATYGGILPFDSVGSAQIADGSISVEDLSDDVRNKLRATVDEDNENAVFPGL